MSDDMLAYLLDLCNEAFRSEGGRQGMGLDIRCRP